MTGAKNSLPELKRGVESYFSETTVHGFRYIVEGKNIYEKVFWTIMIIAGFIGGSYFIFDAFNGWQETPLETTIAKISMPIEELDQPAITVCNPSELEMPRRNRWMFVEKLLN